MSDDPDTARRRRAAAELSEHFDAVQILACKLLPDGTSSMTKAGKGLFYARLGMARTFLEQDVAEDRAQALARELKEEEGE